MECREILLYATLEVWNAVGVPFLAMINGGLVPLENCIGNDPGFFYFVPYLAKTFEISLADAVWWFDFTLVGLGILVAITGFFLLTKGGIEKIIVMAAVLAAGYVAWATGNEHIPGFFAFCFFPLMIVLILKKHRTIFPYFLCVGFIIAFSDSIRMYTGTALGIAALSLYFLSTKSIRSTIVCAVLMTVGFGAYSVWFSSIINQRNCYLDGQNIEHGTFTFQHPFWHSIYIGLGFITNDLGLNYADECAEQRVKTVKSEVVYCSPEYEEILKKEVLEMCKHHFQFILRVLFAKSGVLLFYLLKFANVGLLCAWFYRKPWYLELPYFFALCFSALPGLVTVPEIWYLIGFATVATFYGIHSILWALQHGLLDHIKKFLRHFFKMTA